VSATPAQAAPRHRLWIRIAGVLSGAVLALAPLMLLRDRDADTQRAAAPRPLPAAVSAAGLAQRSGVRVVRVASTGAGGLLDLRYQVVDPNTAAAIHDPDTPPALVDERTGLVLGRLLMGHMHHGRAKAGVTYYLIFLNPGDAVRRGDRVSVVLGGARLEHQRVL
jgi:hypothetical protein